MAFVLSSNISNYRLDRLRLTERPGFLEQATVVAAMSALLAGLPIDWFRTRAEVLQQDGNLKMVAVQLLLMLFGVLRIIGRLDSVINAVKLEITVFLFSGLALASLFWSADIGETIRQAVVLSSIAFYGLYLVLRFDLAQIVRMLGVTFLINGIASVVFALAFPVYGLMPTGEWAGVFTQKNGLGLAAALGMPVLIAAGRSTPRWRLVFYAGAICHAGLLFFSESKTMYVAGFGSMCLMIVYKFFRGRKTLRGAVMSSLGGSSVFAIAFATANIGLLARWLDKDVSLTGRVPLWEDLIPILLERPLFGHGFKAVFGGYFSPIHEVWVLNSWEPQHSHNALFNIGLELGLIGVVIFFWGFARAVKRAVHTVNLLPGGVGLWPLTFLSTALLVSISESGITATDIGWLMYVCVVLSVAWAYKSANGLIPGQQPTGEVPAEGSYEERFGSADIELVSSDIG